MFKPGDKVICINSSENYATLEQYNNLKLYSQYEINYYFNDTHVEYLNLKDVKGNFGASRFILLKEYRKSKIIKINNTK